MSLIFGTARQFAGEQAHLERQEKALFSRHSALNLQLESLRCRTGVANRHAPMLPPYGASLSDPREHFERYRRSAKKQSPAHRLGILMCFMARRWSQSFRIASFRDFCLKQIFINCSYHFKVPFTCLCSDVLGIPSPDCHRSDGDYGPLTKPHEHEVLIGNTTTHREDKI